MLGKMRRGRKKAQKVVEPEENEDMNNSFSSANLGDDVSESDDGWSDGSGASASGQDENSSSVPEVEEDEPPPPSTGVIGGLQEAPNLFDFDGEDEGSEEEYSGDLLHNSQASQDSAGGGMFNPYGKNRPPSPTGQPSTPNAFGKSGVRNQLASPQPGRGSLTTPKTTANTLYGARSPETPAHQSIASDRSGTREVPDGDPDHEYEEYIEEDYDEDGNELGAIDENKDYDDDEFSNDNRKFKDVQFENRSRGNGAVGWSGADVHKAEYPDASSFSRSSQRSYDGGRSRGGSAHSRPRAWDDDEESGMTPSRGVTRQPSSDSMSMSAFSFAMETQKTDRRVMMWLVVCLGCSMVGLALVAGGVLGATLLSDRFGGDDDDEGGGPTVPKPSPPTPTDPNPAPAPVPGPTDPAAPAPGPGPEPEPATPTEPKELIQTQALFDLVSAASSDTGATIMQDGTPQNRAYAWLESDPIQAAESDDRKLQRFALQTFFYATEGDKWTGTGWIDGVDECGVLTCVNGVATILDMNLKNVGGVLPPELGLLTGLTRMSIVNDGTGLTGGVPKELGALTQMKEFELQGNSFTEPLPSDLFANWNALETLTLTNNKIPGAIPDSIGSLGSASRVFLNENKFSGKIPESIGSLASILQFSLGQNELTGAIPASIGLISTVKGVYFNDNQLSGPIPESMSNLKAIKAGLDLSNNKLSGTIPPGVASLKAMKMFLVNNNELTGPIPDFSALTNLRTWRVDGNQLTGEVPAGTCTAIGAKGAEAVADCLATVVCSCCTSCCDSAGVCTPV